MPLNIRGQNINSGTTKKKTIQLRDPHELELKIKSAYLQSKTITNIGFKLKPNYIFHKIYDIARGDKLGSSKYSNSSSTDGGIFGNCLIWIRVTYFILGIV